MKFRKLSRHTFRHVVVLAIAAAPLPALGQNGIIAPTADWLWPQVQARITVQTAALSPLGTASLARHGDPAQAVRGLQGGGVFGDYVFARPRFGSFRATSGVLLGNVSGAPLLSANAGPRLGVTLLEGGTLGASAADATAQPYLGLGYNSPALWGGLSVTADVGLIAGRPAGLAGVGRALFGNQGMDLALREMRLAPMLQLGVRYAF